MPPAIAPALRTQATLDIMGARLLLGLRLHIMLRRNSQDALSGVAVRLGSVPVARAMAGLVQAVGRCWPEAFAVMRPCCAVLTVDEALLCDMVRAICQGADPAPLMGDMIAPAHQPVLAAAVTDVALALARAAAPTGH